MAFSTEHDLRQWLEAHGIDTSAWGTGGAKSLGHLWAEYSNGETVFEQDPPARVTSVVMVIIRNRDKVLFEVDQELPGGERRQRNAIPAEKMKPGESVLQAALRCVREELNVTVDSGRPNDEPVAVKVKSSASYPGLPTRYTFYQCEVDVPGLPDGPFPTDEQGDAVSRHFWEWRDENSVRESLDRL